MSVIAEHHMKPHRRRLTLQQSAPQLIGLRICLSLGIAIVQNVVDITEQEVDLDRVLVKCLSSLKINERQKNILYAAQSDTRAGVPSTSAACSCTRHHPDSSECRPRPRLPIPRW